MTKLTKYNDFWSTNDWLDEYLFSKWGGYEVFKITTTTGDESGFTTFSEHLEDKFVIKCIMPGVWPCDTHVVYDGDSGLLNISCVYGEQLKKKWEKDFLVPFKIKDASDCKVQHANGLFVLNIKKPVKEVKQIKIL